MSDTFYVPLSDGRWRATEHTVGPWDAAFQHAGPPSALLGRDIMRAAPRDDMVIARFSCEILGPVPVGELELRTRVVRPGRSVELLESVAHAGGRDVAVARAWRVLRTDSVSVPASLPAPPAVPDEGVWRVPEGWVDGYLSAIDWRSVTGQFGEPGPATMWSRMRYPLVPAEEPGPLERVLIVADSGNGLSNELDIAKWQFINPELTVHLHREAVGEWILIDATTTISAGGAGLATTVLSDHHGPIGQGAQSLLISPHRR
ncbi:MAG TPA: thioesterase family protein [Streptosporangiaceae bacterium]